MKIDLSPRWGGVLFWLSGLLVLALLLLLAELGLQRSWQQARQLRLQQHDYYLSRLEHQLQDSLAAVQLDVSRLATSPLLQRYLQRQDADTLELLEQSYLALARLRPYYDQIRLLDAQGQERLRINRLVSGDGHVVPRAQLQNKAERDYVKVGLALQPGNRYLSPLDLNIEHGQVEIPYKPMLRMVMPVYRDTRLQGLVVINYRGTELLRNLAQALPAPFTPLLLNDQGHWLLGGQDRDWQFMFTDRTGLAVELPHQWAQMQATDSGSLSAGTDCLVYAWTRFGEGTAQAPRWLLGLREPGRTCDALLREHQANSDRIMLAGGLAGLALLGGRHLLRRRQHRLYRQIADREQQLHLITHEAGNGLIMVDARGCTRWINPEAERLLGWREAELLGENLHEMIHIGPDGKVLHPDECPTHRALRTGQRQQSQRDFFRTRGGHVLPVHATVTPMPKGPYSGGAIISFSDDTDHLVAENHLRRQATTDELTGCLNRRATLQQLEKAIDAGTAFGVIMIDLDYFKQINDEYGHPVGDRVLAFYTQETRELLRSQDTFGRIGGEEFLVLAEHLQADDLLQLAERIRHHFDARCCPIDGPASAHRLHVTASFGVAMYQPGESASALLARADRALYWAKDSGRNRVVAADTAPALSAID